MSIWKHTFRGVFILGNLIVGTGFLCCAYSPLVSPVAHPVLACAGLGCIAVGLFRRREARDEG